MPTLSDPQRWYMAAEKDELLADLLVFLGRPDDWYDLYKALETARDAAVGRGWEDLKAFLGAEVRGFDDLKQTLNHYRHASRHHKLPKSPPTLAEARATINRIARIILDYKAAAAPRS